MSFNQETVDDLFDAFIMNRACQAAKFADFVAGYGSRKKRPLRPDFRDALETQYICEAVLDSAKTGRWKKVGKIRSKAK